MSVLPVPILGIGTAVPGHTLEQSRAKEFARGLFSKDFPALEKLLGVFSNTQIERRQLAQPASWYAEPHDFPEKNAIYVETALALSRQAAQQALAEAAIDPKSLGAIVFASSTGISTPSLDARLIQDLGMRTEVARLPLWGLGCAGGGAGLARAADMARGLGAPVLLVCVEVCSVTFVYEDRRKANLVATALFGDGAAAVVVGAPASTTRRGDETRPVIMQGISQLLRDTEQVMGWDLCATGLKVRFSPEIPQIVRRLGPSLVAQARRVAKLDPRERFEHWVVHPGGAKVLEAYQESLQLEDGALDSARSTLREHGNMSSPTVIFVLKEHLRRTEASGKNGVILGLGPGFCAEGVTFRW